MKDIVENGKILEIKSGSHLYGLNTPTSDEDYVGVFLAPKEYIYGLKHVEQVDLSIVDKHENGKNTKFAIDRKYFEFKRFVELCAQGNPNIIELLFTSEDNIVYISNAGRKLLNNKHLFVSRNIIPKFLGYATSQKRKLMVKTENMKSLIEGVELLSKEIDKGNDKITLPELIGVQEFDSLFKESSNKVHFNIGAYTLNRNITIKSAIKWLRDLIANSSNRLDNVKNVGYEHKYASHLLRLLYQTIDMCETGNICYPLKNRELLLKVKKGEVPYSEFLDLVDSAEEHLARVKDNNILPKSPNIKEIEKLVMEVYEEWLVEKKK